MCISNFNLQVQGAVLALMKIIWKEGVYFYRNESSEASAKEYEGVLQAKTLHFSEVIPNLALAPNIEVSFLSA